MISGHKDFSLYIHWPWCVRKCPYCDFNSHLSPAVLPEEQYALALIADLDFREEYWQGRRLQSVFMGGGTPSLIHPREIARVLAAIDQRLGLDGVEVTMEANPQSVDQHHFQGYRDAGVNRISLGVQSFHPEALTALGRVHSEREARAAIEMAMGLWDRVNVDLMFGLPHVSLRQGLQDLESALSYGVEHLSWYQLTLEPNTPFARQPPAGLPPSELIEDLYEAGIALLARAGYRQYEISAYTRKDPCRHNVHYWQYGDYLGLGAGAHSKWHGDQITRWSLYRQPSRYLASEPAKREETWSVVHADEALFEMMLNRSRMPGTLPWHEIASRTGAAMPPRWIKDPELTRYIRSDAWGLEFLPDAMLMNRAFLEYLLDL